MRPRSTVSGAAVAQIRGGSALLDGEIVAIDENDAHHSKHCDINPLALKAAASRAIAISPMRSMCGIRRSSAAIGSLK